MNTSTPDYVARMETKNVILRPQLSPKNPKSWGQSQKESRQFVMNQRLVLLRVVEAMGLEPTTFCVRCRCSPN